MQLMVPHPLLSQLSELLSTQMGLYYPEKRLADLERGIISAAPALGVGSPEACVRQLLSGTLTRKQVEILASHLTVGETYFFREKKSFTVLEEHIFPELMRTCARANRQLRIWSAGCCTGEEPYSIAMLLDRLIGHSEKWNATILATDINPVFLQKAAEGLYSEWSFRETPVWIKERYFKQRKKGQFEILPHIRKRVTFSYLNLAEDAYPSLTNDTHAMDVIFCRNVLMYFSPKWLQKIGKNLYRALVNGGWLIVSPAEVSGSLFSQFKATPFPGSILYQKIQKQESQPSVAEYPASAPDPIPNALCTPVATLTQASFFQDEGISFSLKHISTEALSAVTSAHSQPAKAAQHVEIDPEHPGGLDALCRTARFHANLGELTEAIKWCEKAIAANKLNPAAHYLLATIHQELGQVEIAAQSLMRTLYLDSDFVLAHFALGNLRLSQDQRQEAERHFDNALALLHAHPHDELPLEADGLTAGRLTEIITSVRANLSRSTPET